MAAGETEEAEKPNGGEALREARRLLEALCAKSAASALIVIGEVAQSCDEEAESAVMAAERAMRDVVVLRCQSHDNPWGRSAFFLNAEQAFGQPLGRELQALLLIAFHKIKIDRERQEAMAQAKAKAKPKPAPKMKSGGRGPPDDPGDSSDYDSDAEESDEWDDEEEEEEDNESLSHYVDSGYQDDEGEEEEYEEEEEQEDWTGFAKTMPDPTKFKKKKEEEVDYTYVEPPPLTEETETEGEGLHSKDKKKKKKKEEKPPPSRPTVKRKAAATADATGTTMFDIEPNGDCVTRKEADKLVFQKFDGVMSFRDRWVEIRREVLHKSGRKALATIWFDQIKDVKGITFEQLAVTGSVFEQYDAKLLDAVLKAADKNLFREIRREEDLLMRNGKDLTGRQALRIVYKAFTLNEVQEELFNVTHLQQIPYSGDDHMDEFLDIWIRVVNDQNGDTTEKQLEHIFYEKIKGSKNLKPWIEYYDRIGEEHPDHTYDYLLTSLRTYLQKVRHDKFMEGYMASVNKKHGIKPAKGKGRYLTPAATEGQCPFHLRKGCNDPENCSKGDHDPQFKHALKGKGRGTEKGGGGGGGGGRDPKGRGGGRGRKGDPKGGRGRGGRDPKGAKGGRNPKGGGRTAKGDPKGKGKGQGNSKHAGPGGGADAEPCFTAMTQACPKKNCKFRHSNFTPEDREKYKAWKKKRDEDSRAAAAAEREDDASGEDLAAKPPKAKAKAKGKAAKKGGKDRG